MQGVESQLHKSQWQTPIDFTEPTIFPRVLAQNSMNKIFVPKYNLGIMTVQLDTFFWFAMEEKKAKNIIS